MFESSLNLDGSNPHSSLNLDGSSTTHSSLNLAVLVRSQDLGGDHTKAYASSYFIQIRGQEIDQLNKDHFLCFLCGDTFVGPCPR